SRLETGDQMRLTFRSEEVDVVGVVGVNAAAMDERERTRTHSRRVLEGRVFCQRLELKSRVGVNALVVSEAGAAFGEVRERRLKCSLAAHAQVLIQFLLLRLCRVAGRVRPE